MPLTLPTDRVTPTNPTAPGTLFVVATPIGHMEDITLRAIRTLKEAELIAAEDTRQTRKLLTRYEISTPLVSYHDHNKEKRTPALLEKLQAGKSIALVTDAGTPSISDPGYYLVRAAIRAAIPVVPIPGASAVVAALSVSGLPTDSFVFVGFVPRKAAKRKDFLKKLKEEPRTLIFYESPKRLPALMQEMIDLMGDRSAVVARELTKIHEEIIRGSLCYILKVLKARPPLKGEYTLLVGGCEEAEGFDRNLLVNELRRLRLETNRPLSDLVKEVAKKYGLSRKVVYEEALKLKKES
ncbi:MAG: 16S rRNA (cytidine(1402)-2'-O)-methyltransferase [Deltaproteobacteria bacterium]|nr:16S rRNA (cytidine(1402)-2'-O)-methyltransferase [Deltaproteobacteria bacterium]MBW2018961.1 16S rRNA (cytidine(1402)-2'-O)-methyltransferase [Deltaproteobacteria bacterium]MBW2073551.1 16S rRNA (cytidine(1402)-2'-O)-methyltransferase [Deltaproteobacteria bacterium]